LTTSNNTSWELNRDELITRAYAKLGLPGEGNTLSTAQLADGAQALNAVVALAVTDGMPLWKRITLTVTPSTTNQNYTIPSGVKVAGVYIRDNPLGTQYALMHKSLYDFKQLPTNSGPGLPIHWTWAPAIQGGIVSFWPATSDPTTVATKYLDIIYQKEFDGFFTSTETPDFPAYWTLALIYKTAVLLAPEQGVPLQDRQALIQEAALYWKQASDYGDEDGSLYIQPDRRYRRKE
jgi:hypothetical protein